MARRDRNKNTSRSEENSYFSNDINTLLRTPSITRSVQPTFTHTSPTSNPLTDIEDRRTWHPQGSTRNARSVDRPTHTLVIPQHPKNVNTAKSKTSLPHTVQFQAPAKVAICIRRKSRKEVLFALKKTGKGARSKKRRNFYSDIRC